MYFDAIEGLGPIHPGEILLEDILPASGLTKTAFAQRLGVTRLTLHNVLVGKSSVSTVFALKLARLLGTSPQMWLNLQQAYDLAIISKDKRSEIDEIEALKLH